MQGTAVFEVVLKVVIYLDMTLHKYGDTKLTQRRKDAKRSRTEATPFVCHCKRLNAGAEAAEERGEL